MKTLIVSSILTLSAISLMAQSTAPSTAAPATGKSSGAATSQTDNEMRQQALKELQGIATMLKKDDVKHAEKRAQAWLKDHPGMEK